MQTGKPVRESAELDTVTEKESFSLARREANKTFGVRLTELLPFNSAGGDFQTVKAGGLVWMYDALSWMTDLAVDIGGGSGGRFSWTPPSAPTTRSCARTSRATSGRSSAGPR
jgi:hypothetical protein